MASCPPPRDIQGKVSLPAGAVSRDLVYTMLVAYLHNANPSALIKLMADAMTEVAFTFNCEDCSAEADVLESVSHVLLDAYQRAMDIEELG